MEIGGFSVAEIHAREKWNATGIPLVAGHRYHFVSEGEWLDWTIACDADGYESANLIQRIAEPLRRVRTERWFVLMGALTRYDAAAFRIGKETIATPNASGELFCFANDVWFAYCNNHGALRLRVTRIELGE